MKRTVQMKNDKKGYPILFPRRCMLCNEVAPLTNGYCSLCDEKILRMEEPVCKKCGKQVEDVTVEYCKDCIASSHIFVQGKALYPYQEKMRSMMYRYKYHNYRYYAKYWAREIVTKYGAWIRENEISAIVPIPLHKKKKRRRGYNQAALLAREIGRLLEIKTDEKMLFRNRFTKPQKGLGKIERKNNLKNAFNVSKNGVQYAYILLIDDIYTTGSTIDSAGKVLLENGAKKVFAIYVCIGKGL